MGFWHTGYIEHHEVNGLNFDPRDAPSPEFHCTHCDKLFGSDEGLRKHLFEDHPQHRPRLVLQGREIGTGTVRITEPVAADDVGVSQCDRAALNGTETSVADVPRGLARLMFGVCNVKLYNGGALAEFRLDFQIASAGDLKGIEDEFTRMARGKRLDRRAIDDFITATKRFGSAIGYSDGICAYLYGVLAKEKHTDSSLPYDQYVSRFNKAAYELADYPRPLARTIRGLIAFHFNHFAEARRLAHGTRLGRAAERYVVWLTGVASAVRSAIKPRATALELDALLTDWTTEQILDWTVRASDDPPRDTKEMASTLNHCPADYDRTKLHVLLSETYLANMDCDPACRHAKELRNRPGFDRWAESTIEKCKCH